MKRCLFAAAFLLQAAAWAGPSGYELTGRIDIPGETHWDHPYYDAPSHRLYITQSPVVTVLDTETRKVVGTVTNVPAAHDVAIDHELNLGFASSGRANGVVVFDLDTFERKAAINAADPRAMLFDPRSHRLLVIADRTRSVGIIDPKTHKLVGKSLYLEGPAQLAAVGKNGIVYVNVAYDDSLVGIDPVKVRQVSRHEFKECRNPSGLAVDPKWRLYSVCRNGKLVVSSPEGKPLVVETISDPRWADGIDGAVFQDGHLFVSNGRNGTLLVVDETRPGHFELVETIPTERGARTLTADPDNHRLYSVSADIDPSTSWDHPKAQPGTLHVLVIERR